MKVSEDGTGSRHPVLGDVGRSPHLNFYLLVYRLEISSLYCLYMAIIKEIKMKNILKSGINSNMLKTIAIIAMVIDHIGFYFNPMLPTGVYIACRWIGRIAMPIFVYLLVQGFFHTKDFKKYVLRIGMLAIITQVLITVLMIINIKYISSYIYAKQIYMTGNILFTFVMSLLAMKVLHEDILIKKWTYNKNLSLKIILVSVIFILCIFLPLDYGVEALILSILMYYIEKFKIKVLIQKSSPNITIKNIILKSITESKIKIIYLALILFSLSLITVYFNAFWTVLLAIIPIALYNGERGKINMKYVYYIVFPLQHILLYLGALIVTLT